MNEIADADGQLYRPIKKAISLRIDADILAWLKSLDGKYQPRINSVLREYMEQRSVTRPEISVREDAALPQSFDIPLSKEPPWQDSELIQKYGAQKLYRKNTILIEEGDEANTLFIIVDGRVKAYISKEGKEIVLNTHGPGEYFGEIALLTNSPRETSFITLEDSRFMVLTKKSFFELLTVHPGMAYRVAVTLAHRVRALTENVKNLGLRDVYQRLAHVFMDTASETDGQLVTPQFSQQDLADIVGSSREMVSKILKDLKAGGYITTEGKRIRINKKLPANW